MANTCIAETTHPPPRSWSGTYADSGHFLSRDILIQDLWRCVSESIITRRGVLLTYKPHFDELVTHVLGPRALSIQNCFTGWMLYEPREPNAEIKHEYAGLSSVPRCGSCCRLRYLFTRIVEELERFAWFCKRLGTKI